MSRRRWAAVALLLLTVAAVVLVRATRGPDTLAHPEPAPPPGISPGTVTRTAGHVDLPPTRDLATISGVITIDAGPHPDWLIMTGDTVWVAGVGDDNGTTVARYRTSTAELLGLVRIGTESNGIGHVPAVCVSMATGFGSVWVVDCPSKTLSRFDISSGAVLATIALPVTAVAVNTMIAAGEGGVFVLSSGGKQTIVRVDPVTNAIVGTVNAPPGASALYAGAGALWISSAAPGAVRKTDPITGATISLVETTSGERFLAMGDGSLWARNDYSAVVSRIDPQTCTVIASVQVSTRSFGGGDLHFGGGYLWARVSDALVAQVDPSTNTVIARYGKPSDYGSAVASEHELWISSATEQKIWRVPLD